LRTVLRHLCIASALLLVPVASAHAQSLLYYPISARVVSMGVTGVADNSTPSTIVLNPANVVGPPRIYVQGAMLRTDTSEDFWIHRANAGASWHFGPVLFGADLAYARLNSEGLLNSIGEPRTLTQDVVELTSGLGVSIGRNDFLFGLAGKRFADTDEPTALDSLITTADKADAFAFDAGAEIRHRATLQGWDITTSLGAAVINVGNDVEHDDGKRHLPRHLNGGLSVSMVSPPVQVFWGAVPLVAFSANVDATKPRDQDWEWMAGTEVGLWQVLFVRSGIRTFTGTDGNDPAEAAWGLGLGLPIRMLRVRLDYGRDSESFDKLERWELTLERTF